MKYITVQNIQVPTIGLGTWRLYGKECSHIVTEALEMGYRHIDTAQMYENEFDVGDGVKNASVDRDDVFITTKLSSLNMNMGQGLESFENSLRKLQTDYVDLLLMHSPPEQPLDIIEQMLSLKQQGKVKAIGMSNFYGDTLNLALKEFDNELITNQIEVHPFVDTKGTPEQLWSHNMFVTAYSPLARGRVLKDGVITSLAEKYQKTNAQIVLRWLLQKGDLVVIPKSSSVKRLEQNFDVYDFELNEDDILDLNDLPKDGRIVTGDWLN